MDITIRPVTLDDVPILAELTRANRAFLAPWEPIRDDEYYTVAGHHKVVQSLLNQYGQGVTVPHVILDRGRLVGRITLNEIVRGPLQSCSLGYWVDASANGRGIATAAVREITRLAFEELRLHRVQASTLLHNVGSQRVLERAGFVRFGMAPRYLRIAGQWQDHTMYQLLSPVPD